MMIPVVQCSATHLGLENAAVIGHLEEEPAEAGPDHDQEQRPPARPRGQHGDCGPQTRNRDRHLHSL